MREFKDIQNIQVRNPHVRRLVTEELNLGAGRNHTEAAENLICEAVEARRLKRAKENPRRLRQVANVPA